MIWICGVDELDEDELELEDELEFAPELLLPPPPDELADDAFVRPDPVDDPLRFVPPVPVPLSCCPTVRLTAATVPSMGAVSVAPLREACALASWAWAAARLAWSDAIWALDDPVVSSLESLAVAESTL